MEGSVQDKQRAIQTPSDVFWTMQLPGNLPKHDE